MLLSLLLWRRAIFMHSEEHANEVEVTFLVRFGVGMQYIARGRDTNISFSLRGDR